VFKFASFVDRTTDSGASTHFVPARTRPASPLLTRRGRQRARVAPAHEGRGPLLARVRLPLGGGGSRGSEGDREQAGARVELCKRNHARSAMTARANACNKACSERSASEHVITNPPYPYGDLGQPEPASNP
jgi:hypothetical protein